MNYHDLEKLSPFLWRRRLVDRSGALYLHWCQGCKHAHTYPIGDTGSPHNWSFNGNIESPSFSPSMLIFTPERQAKDGTVHRRETRCHYFVTNGQIQYQGDCRHELRGQTLPLEPIPDDYGF